MIIRAKNNLTEVAQKTNLSHGEASGVTSLRVKNINAFSSNWGIQIGETNQEQSEVRVISAGAVSGTALTVSAATSYSHPTDTPVYAIKYNQIVFMRSTTGTAGTAAALTDGTISITPDSQFTQFDDTTGAASYAYKTKFRNSATGDVSSESDWITPTGYNFYSLAKMRQRIKDKLYDTGYISQEDDKIDDWINEWLESMTNAAIEVNQDFAIGTTEVSFSGTAELGTITVSDFKQPRRVWMTSDGLTYYKSSKIGLTDFAPNQIFSISNPYHYFKGDTVIGRKPADTSGTAVVDYYKLNAVLVDEADELPLPFRGYTKSFIHYGLAQAYAIDGKATEALSEERKAEAERQRFKVEMTPRDETGPSHITIVEPVTGDDYIEF